MPREEFSIENYLPLMSVVLRLRRLPAYNLIYTQIHCQVSKMAERLRVNNSLPVSYCVSCTLTYPLVNIILLQQLFSPARYLACSLGFYFVIEHFSIPTLLVLSFGMLNIPTLSTTEFFWKIWTNSWVSYLFLFYFRQFCS